MSGLGQDPVWNKKSEWSLDSKLTPAQRAKLEAALDKVMSTLATKPIEILGSLGMQKAFAHELWRRFGKEERKRRRCVIPGCQHYSIKASHALQRGGPLALIAENGHVLSPGFRISTCEAQMDRIGIGRASTFPGFCPQHERLFEKMETRQSAPTDDDIQRQVLRTLCQQLVMRRQECEGLKRQFLVWQLVIHFYGSRVVIETLGKDLTPEITPRSFTTNYSTPLEQFLLNAWQEAEKRVEELEKTYVPAALADVEGRENGMAHVVFRCEENLPVCLAGMGNFTASIKGPPQTVTAILNVWPTKKGVMIVMSAEEQYHAISESVFKGCLSRSLGPLEMVETWMINGTNQWFIRPSAWEKIPQARAKRILKHTMETNHDLGTPYHLSIFDDIRRAAIHDADANTDISSETAKLAD